MVLLLPWFPVLAMLWLFRRTMGVVGPYLGGFGRLTVNGSAHTLAQVGRLVRALGLITARLWQARTPMVGSFGNVRATVTTDVPGGWIRARPVGRRGGWSGAVARRRGLDFVDQRAGQAHVNVTGQKKRG